MLLLAENSIRKTTALTSPYYLVVIPAADHNRQTSRLTTSGQVGLTLKRLPLKLSGDRRPMVNGIVGGKN